MTNAGGDPCAAVEKKQRNWETQPTVPNPREISMSSRISQTIRIVKYARWQRSHGIPPPTSFGDLITSDHQLSNLDDDSRNYHSQTIIVCHKSVPGLSMDSRLEYSSSFDEKRRNSNSDGSKCPSRRKVELRDGMLLLFAECVRQDGRWEDSVCQCQLQTHLNRGVSAASVR